jgi:hypothetical protein
MAACRCRTHVIERLNEAFRRRVKTHGALPTAPTAERLVDGLLLTGHIRMRRLDGWRERPAILRPWRRPSPREGGGQRSGRLPIAS